MMHTQGDKGPHLHSIRDMVTVWAWAGESGPGGRAGENRAGLPVLHSIEGFHVRDGYCM